MASGRHVEYTLRLNSNATSVLLGATTAANKFDNSMWQVQKTLASFGLGLGAHFLIDAAKNWTQAAADYETAMLRIRNASKEGLGVFNSEFLLKETNFFKLKLQETSDAYGSFLFKIRNAGLSNDVQNRLFDNLTLVGKVSAIPQEQMDATVRNLGILLGEGVLEARHLRAISYVHPQIVPYLAKALGLKDNQKDAFAGILNEDTDDATAMQKLSKLISSGKLTKLALNSSILIDAFELYRESIETKLPETLRTVQSELNVLSNTWLTFKNNLVLDQKEELIHFFHSLEDSIKWLADHEAGIIRVGKVIFDVFKIWAEYKLIQLGINLALGAYNAISGLFISNVVTQTSTTAGLNSQLTILNNNLRVLIQLSTDAAVSMGALSEIEAIEFSQQVDRGVGSAAIASGAARGGFLASGMGILNVAVMSFLGATILDTLFPSDAKTKEGGSTGLFHPINNIEARSDLYRWEDEMKRKGYVDVNNAWGGLAGWQIPKIEDFHWILKSEVDLMNARAKTKEINDKLMSQYETSELASGLTDRYKGEPNKTIFDYYTTNKGYDTDSLSGKKVINIHDENGKVIAQRLITSEDSSSIFDWTKGTDFGKVDSTYNDSIFKQYGLSTPGKPTPKLNLPDEKHKLHGNSSNYFTVNIHELNGIKTLDVKQSSATDIENIKDIVGTEITRNLLEIINDIQVVKTGH